MHDGSITVGGSRDGWEEGGGGGAEGRTVQLELRCGAVGWKWPVGKRPERRAKSLGSAQRGICGGTNVRRSNFQSHPVTVY